MCKVLRIHWHVEVDQENFYSTGGGCHQSENNTKKCKTETMANTAKVRYMVQMAENSIGG